MPHRGFRASIASVCLALAACCLAQTTPSPSPSPSPADAVDVLLAALSSIYPDGIPEEVLPTTADASSVVSTPATTLQTIATAATNSASTIPSSGPTDAAMTSCPASEPSDDETPRYCRPFSNPDEGINNVCNCDDGGYYSADSPCDMCPWTTTPPASMTVQIFSDTSEGPSVTFPANPDCQRGKVARSGCWDSIGATVAIQQFWESNEAACREDGHEGFANCWYSRKLGRDQGDCGDITVASACSASSWEDFSDSENEVLDYYISLAIWNSNQFLNNVWHAIGDALSSAGDQIGALVDELVPKDTTNPLKYILFAISFAMGLYAEGPASKKALLRTPALSSTLLNALLFPASTKDIDSKITAWSQTQSKLGFLADQWKADVSDASAALFRDPGMFLQWCNGDFWCTGEAADLQGLSTDMKLTLGTYMASEIIKDIGLVVSRAADLDVAKLQATSGSELMWDTECDEYDEFGVCGSYAFDGTDTYSIISKTTFQTDTAAALQILFSGAAPLTTAKMLFAGAYECDAKCDAVTQDCAPWLEVDGDSVRPVCLSTLDVCTWNWYEQEPWVETDACPNDMFGWRWCQDRCKAFDDLDCTVPKTYLGGGIMNNWTSEDPWSTKKACNFW